MYNVLNKVCYNVERKLTVVKQESLEIYDRIKGLD